jgi:16S rRNA (cytosine1402-N4)-methyltransferase
MENYGEHYSVMKDNYLELFKSTAKNEKKYFCDLTFGAGGHAFAILKEFPNAILVACDQDPDALKNAKKIIAENGLADRVILIDSNFSNLFEIFKKNMPTDFNGFSGIIADLGVSSHHFDSSERGFSFRFDGPLDMRMDTTNNPITAEDLVNDLDHEDLANIIYEYGEERYSRKIAEKIIEEREKKRVSTTKELENIVFHVYPARQRHSGAHPATRTFQALRIKVNDELGVLEKLLEHIPQMLAIDGMAAIISFHSLEDRIAKHRFKKIIENEKFEILTKKPILPSELEIKSNFRSRSAKMRVLKRIK